AAGSMQTINCTDGSTDSKSLAADYVDVRKGTTATTLVGSYFCDWKLNLNAQLTETSLVPSNPAQVCMRTVNGTMFTWHGTKFQMTTLDGVTAQLQMEVPSELKTAAGQNSCLI